MTSPRRPRAWADLKINENLASDGSQKFDLLEKATVNLDTITVVRLVGKLTVIPAVVADSTIGVQLIQIGIGVASTEAFTAGIASLPDPNVDTEAPPRGWIYKQYETFVNQQDLGTVEAFRFPEFQFDNRAMRKIDRGVLFMVMNSVDLLATATTVKVVGLIRALCLT